MQILIRDLYGGVIFNQAFPNLPIAVTSISLFLHVWEGFVSQVVMISPEGRSYKKTTFKIMDNEEEGLYLQSPGGDKILLPIPEDLDEDDDFFFDDEDNEDGSLF